MKRKALLSHGSAVIDDAIVLLQAFKQGRVDADSPLAGPLVELLGDELYRRKPHLWLPTDIIKKILACLPARECWRIGRRLNHAYKEWTESIIMIHTATAQLFDVFFPISFFSGQKHLKITYLATYNNSPTSALTFIFHDMKSYINQLTRDLLINFRCKFVLNNGKKETSWLSRKSNFAFEIKEDETIVVVLKK